MHNRITSLVFYKSQWITRIQPFSSSTWRIAGWDEYYKNGNFQHIKPVRFYSPTMYLSKDGLAKLRFFSPHGFSSINYYATIKKSHAQISQHLIKNIQNLVHFITWQSLHLRSFIVLIGPFITWLTPKWKAVNSLVILTPAHTSRYTPHNHQVNVSLPYTWIQMNTPQT